MDQELKFKFEEEISNIVDKELINTSSQIKEYQASLGAINKIVNMLDIERKIDISEKNQNDRLKLDKQELKHNIELDDRKIVLEESKYKLDVKKLENLIEQNKLSNEIELEKIKLEREKLEYERYEKNNEIKESKKNRIFNGIIKGLEIVLPLSINTILILMNFRLIYKDDGRTPSEMKDLMKYIYRK